MANFWCVDSEMSQSVVIMKIPISGVLRYGQSHCDIIIQINNNENSLALIKEQNGFSKCKENLRGCGQPKWQNLPLKKFILAKTCKKR